MKRRDAIAVLAGIALGTGRAAQAQRSYRIGTLTAAWAPNHPSVEGLQSGLAALGLSEGREAEFEHRYVEGRIERLPAAAASLLAKRVDVLFSVAENATQAAAAATASVPIVFANVGDPVALGLVRELSHPGGNVTGVSDLAAELVPKRLEMLKALSPAMRRVWAIYDAASGAAVLRAAARARDAAPKLNVEFLDRPVRSAEELGSALAGVGSGDGLLHLSSGGTSLDVASRLLETAARAKALTMFSSAFWLEHGALAAYGADQRAVGVQAARLVAKILAGVRPEDVPVEGANQIGLAINLKVARAIGISIPGAALLRAERVIE